MMFNREAELSAYYDRKKQEMKRY